MIFPICLLSLGLVFQFSSSRFSRAKKSQIDGGIKGRDGYMGNESLLGLFPFPARAPLRAVTEPGSISRSSLPLCFTSPGSSLAARRQLLAKYRIAPLQSRGGCQQRRENQSPRRRSQLPNLANEKRAPKFNDTHLLINSNVQITSANLSSTRSI